MVRGGVGLKSFWLAGRSKFFGCMFSNIVLE